MLEVHRLDLAVVTLPEWHPRVADVTCSVAGFAIAHPDGVLVFDTGCGRDHPLIDELYSPTVTPLVHALHDAGLDERDVVAIANSHLHFDHCGQNDALGDVPVYVREAELECVERPYFTVPEWARVPDVRRRVVVGDEEIAPGLTLMSTPGHTPGHQSLRIDDPDGSCRIVAGQPCYDCAEFRSGEFDHRDVFGDEWIGEATDSLERLRALGPTAVHLAHDR